MHIPEFVPKEGSYASGMAQESAEGSIAEGGTEKPVSKEDSYVLRPAQESATRAPPSVSKEDSDVLSSRQESPSKECISTVQVIEEARDNLSSEFNLTKKEEVFRSGGSSRESDLLAYASHPDDGDALEKDSLNLSMHISCGESVAEDKASVLDIVKDKASPSTSIDQKEIDLEGHDKVSIDGNMAASDSALGHEKGQRSQVDVPYGVCSVMDIVREDKKGISIAKEKYVQHDENANPDQKQSILPTEQPLQPENGIDLELEPDSCKDKQGADPVESRMSIVENQTTSVRSEQAHSPTAQTWSTAQKSPPIIKPYRAEIVAADNNPMESFTRPSRRSTSLDSDHHYEDDYSWSSITDFVDDDWNGSLAYAQLFRC
ncbi:hypothetical protein KP509_05G088300 [Ceratopteris richardii]|uniref:Uncharacterized protein n=1 Tax=Ceratopteris richardii TaxID=49495 RepID=A0A8T2UW10_CERRI|nr:hypothetical protein KP509_05G088300 [Ceratopteris richardii]